MTSQACCAAGAPVSCDYEPKGRTDKVGDADTYFIGGGPNAIIVLYDAFGTCMQTKQICDKLADAGFNVASLDHFRGAAVKPSDFGVKKIEDLIAYIDTHGSFPDVVQPDLERLRSHMQEHRGAKNFGLLGFCWGGESVMKAAGTLDWVQAGAMAHAARLTTEQAEQVKVPLLILPSKEEPDFTTIFDILNSKPFGKENVFKRFDDMHHGWCASRGDWANPEQRDRATEAVNMFINFFQKNLQG